MDDDDNEQTVDVEIVVPKRLGPFVRKKQRSRTKHGNWRKKRSDAGKPRRKNKSLLDLPEVASEGEMPV